jgi:hypothetical protein
MACRATRRDTGVVHRRARPECRRRRRRPFGVTGPALRRGDWNVVGRFADRRQAVMAPPDCTSSCDRNRGRVRAVIRGRCSGERCQRFVAGIARARRRNMYRRFADNSNIGPTMAGGTGTAADSDPGMAKWRRRSKCNSVMTVLTPGRGRAVGEMIGGFGDHRDPIEGLAGRVARHAPGRDTGMVHRCARPERRRRRRRPTMTGSALRGGNGDMGSRFADRRQTVMTAPRRTGGGRRDRRRIGAVIRGR